MNYPELAANAFNAVSIVLAGRNSVHTWWTGIVCCVLFCLWRLLGECGRLAPALAEAGGRRMRLFSPGLVVGKFAPLHKGHELVIATTSN